MVWAGSRDNLVKFLESLQVNTYNIKFTYTFDQRRITFLDVESFINDMGELCSTLYRKTSAGNSFLHASSSHPEQLIKCIPYSQLLRIKCIWTMDEDFQKEADLLRERLLTRGYSKTSWKKAFNRVKKLNRHSHIYGINWDKRGQARPREWLLCLTDRVPRFAPSITNFDIC